MSRDFTRVLLGTFVYFVSIGALLPTVPLYVQGPLAGGTVSVGLSVGAFSAAALVLRPWAGQLGDRRGSRCLVIAGAALVAVSVAGYLVATSIQVLVALRLVSGAGEALFFVGVVTAANDLVPDARRAEAMSLFSLAPNGGVAVGIVVAEAVLDRRGFVAVWAISATAALIALGVGLLVRPTAPASPYSAVRSRVLHPAGLFPGVLMLFIIVGFAGFVSFVPLYGRELGMDGAPLPLVAFASVLIVVRGAGARIPTRLGTARTVRAAFTGAAIGLATIAIWPSAGGLLVGTIVFAAGQALAFPTVLAWAVTRAPAAERSSVVGTITAFLDLALAVGPVGLGLVAATYGLRATFLVSSGCAATGLFLLRARSRLLAATPNLIRPRA